MPPCPPCARSLSMTDQAGRQRPTPLSPPVNQALPAGFRIRLDPRVRLWADVAVLIGGSPWRISRLSRPARDVVIRLRAAGAAGLALDSTVDLRAARVLLDRGFVHPVARRRPANAQAYDVIVPAMDHPANIDRLLGSLGQQNVLVVDDGSLDPQLLADVAARHGASITHHAVNAGPAAARNTGLAHTSSPLVAFIDSDCIADSTWPGSLLSHFDDPAVAAVAPRVAPTSDGGTVLERYETTRSSLDMGCRPELVRPGARLGFVPSAALVVRRAALGSSGFDAQLRLGEDVDLAWRLAEAGWLVRYDPSTVIRHQTRTRPAAWLRRRFEYGTSASALAERHPGNLTPARLSEWNLGALVLIAAGHPVVAAGVLATAAALLHRRLIGLPHAPALAARTISQGVVADAAGIGHLLRREWWPIGAAALALTPRSRIARAAAVCMIVPIAWEWLTDRPALDPVRYTALRLIDDAAYGTGVIASAVRARSRRPLTPSVVGRRSTTAAPS